MPKNYDTESEEYEATLYTDYDDAANDDVDEFEEPLVADFSDDEDEEAAVNPQENLFADRDTTDEDDDEGGELD